MEQHCCDGQNLPKLKSGSFCVVPLGDRLAPFGALGLLLVKPGDGFGEWRKEWERSGAHRGREVKGFISH